jgi:hypothetical protein
MKTDSVSDLLTDMSPAEISAATVELCERGLFTCTRDRPGDADATYALAWLPLDHPEQFSFEVRRRHALNMKRFDLQTTQAR